MARILFLLSALGFVSALDQQVLSGPVVHGQHKDKPLIDTKSFQKTIKGDNLLARAKELYEIAKTSQDEWNHPTRVIGSAVGHQATLEWIYSTIAKLGDYYTLSNQSFPVVLGRVNEARLVLENDVSKSMVPFALSPSTPNKQPVFSQLTLIANDGCEASDFPSETKGSIAFIRRGSCFYSNKSSLAGQAGALAAVVYNTDDEQFRGTLSFVDPDHVATVGIALGEAAPIIKRLENGDSIDAIVYVNAELQEIHTTNIVAQTTAGDPDNCVMLGAHSDSVEAGPGINDDGSGTISLLEIATQLTAYNVTNCVRFGWWAGEEEGLLGSEWYASSLSKEENAKIRMFMDYDMMASPNYAYQIYNATNAINPSGSEELRDLYVDWYKDQGLNYSFIPFDGRSDYVGFLVQGIPSGGIATGAEGIKSKKGEAKFGGKAGDWFDPCYHQLCDDVGNLNMTAFVVNTQLIAHSVATYARSLDDYPKRSLEAAADNGQFGVRDMKYRGSYLVM
ncbi:aminopeptidase Y precursor [Microthyrium microscopicum]|uniref:Peptide hydrolase n=1 Tax=Microthyrium microscopicum TaxID=703497 RepID=A0A6A6UHJ2_9PEZI|nr:aminopeptidase Y precursor [Microthyrium microscopicum]